jgi:Dolichyl-phosphate-mannose-protein mannosyltransferase
MPARILWGRIAEAAGVGLSPAIVALVLRLRLMAPIDLPDPAMHTIYIVDPRDVYTRYAAVYAATARLREGARVGFLVPARLSYLAFGSVPGFLVLRYVFALIAVVPVYLLLRRLFGPPAGVAGILIVLSSPVLVTAWGTDYPDSAVVSYAIGALACLAMPGRPRCRRGWLAAAGALLILAVWSHGVAIPLAAATLAGYLGVRLVRDRAGLLADLAVLAGAAAAVTGLLIVAAATLLGHGDFITATWQAYRYMSEPVMVHAAHSSSWRWAPYVAYLLVPPAVLAALAVTVARRDGVPTPVLLVGVMAAVQLVVFAWLQFFGSVETLEQHYFSSTLWAGVLLAFAIMLGELCLPLAGRPVARWLPAAVALAIPLAYEAWPHVPAFGWAPAGFALALVIVGAALATRAAGRLAGPLLQPVAAATGLAVLVAAALVLTVAPEPAHRQLPGTLPATADPPPAYATALGGSAAGYFDAYRISAELPGFVRPAAYNGEQLLIWWPVSDSGFPYREYAGMYHGLFNSLPSDVGTLTTADVAMLRDRRPAELLLFSRSGFRFGEALRELRAFRPGLMRTTTLRSGPEVLHAWLIRLGRYYHPPAA